MSNPVSLDTLRPIITKAARLAEEAWQEAVLSSVDDGLTPDEIRMSIRDFIADIEEQIWAIAARNPDVSATSSDA